MQFVKSTLQQRTLAKLLLLRLQIVEGACIRDMQAIGGTVPLAQVGSELTTMSIMVAIQLP